MNELRHLYNNKNMDFDCRCRRWQMKISLFPHIRNKHFRLCMFPVSRKTYVCSLFLGKLMYAPCFPENWYMLHFHENLCMLPLSRNTDKCSVSRKTDGGSVSRKTDEYSLFPGIPECCTLNIVHNKIFEQWPNLTTLNFTLAFDVWTWLLYTCIL